MEALQQFISPEFFSVIPVLVLLGRWMKRSRKVRDESIPLALGGIGVGLSVLHTFATIPLSAPSAVAGALFTAFTQGVLCAGAAVYAHQLWKQGRSADSVRRPAAARGTPQKSPQSSAKKDKVQV